MNRTLDSSAFQIKIGIICVYQSSRILKISLKEYAQKTLRIFYPVEAGCLEITHLVPFDVLGDFFTADPYHVKTQGNHLPHFRYCNAVEALHILNNFRSL
jgi:hypothetical protein